jgi:predicted acyltransferase
MTTPTTTPPATPQRLMSLDALRGFDMFWIIGADSLVAAFSKMTQSGPTKFLAEQLEHAEWQGFRFYDLIFPLFIFMVGASIVFSLTKIIGESGRIGAVGRVLRRGLLLFAVGIFYSGGFTNPWPDIRLMGVLNRIALAYTFAGLLFICFKPRTLAAICGSLLLGYWAMMALIPIRDIQLEKTNLVQLAEQSGDNVLAAQLREIGPASAVNPSAIKDSPVWAGVEKLYYATTNRVTGKYGMGYNVACHCDFEHLPGKKWDIFWDPEGFLSTIPAVATCLLGVFAGLLLMNPAFSNDRKLAWLFGAGIAGVLVGWLGGIQFPVIKKIWTSS